MDTQDTQKLSLSDSAAKQVALLKEQQGKDDLMLRVTVQGGGCSGFQYKFSFDNEVKDFDLTFEKDGITFITDDMSLAFITGSEIDFIEDINGSYFTLKNPNAKSSCGCGTSFSV